MSNIIDINPYYDVLKKHDALPTAEERKAFLEDVRLRAEVLKVAAEMAEAKGCPAGAKMGDYLTEEEMKKIIRRVRIRMGYE